MSPTESPAAEDLLRDLGRLRALLAADLAAIPGADSGDDASFDRLAGLVVRHQIAVPLVRRLDAARLGQALPPRLLERLRRRDELQRERTRGLLELHGRLRSELARRSLPYLLLKGLPLARRLYGDVDGRETADLDLLIGAHDAPAVRRALTELGLRQRSRTPFGAAVTTRVVHALDYVAPSGVVDLHWAIDRHPSLRLDSRRIWSAAASQELGGCEVAVASDVDEILVACLGVVRDAERGRLKLKSLLDLRLWLERPGPWPAFLGAAREQRALRPSAHALALAAAAFGEPAELDAGIGAELRAPGLDSSSRAALPSLLRGAPSAASRRWAFHAWESSPALNALWWLVSLPFRIAVHGHRRGGFDRAGKRESIR